MSKLNNFIVIKQSDLANGNKISTKILFGDLIILKK